MVRELARFVAVWSVHRTGPAYTEELRTDRRGEESKSVRFKLCRVPGVHLDQVTADGLPKPHDAVIRAAREALSVRAEGEARHLPIVAFKGAQQLPRGWLPNSDQRIGSPTRNRLSVWRKGNRVDAVNGGQVVESGDNADP